MKRIYIRRGFAALLLTASFAFGTASCTKDLDREPFYGLNTETVYRDPANQLAALAKLYGGLVLTGSRPKDDPNPEVRGADQGSFSYIRLLWKLEELASDEAVVAWGDGSIQPLNTLTWSSNNDFIEGMYNRIYVQVTFANEFIREMSDAKLAERGIVGQDQTNARLYRTEARFLRALSYYHALDLYGNVPFVTEADLPGKFFPAQKSRADLFTYIESELKAIESELMPARQGEYGRADQAAAWMLLAKLYLNADVYTGTARNADVLTYCTKIIGAGYSLAPEYRLLFLADNDVTAKQEIIFPIIADGLRTQSYGNSTFLVHAATGGSLSAASMGINTGWSGIRAKKTLPLNFGISTAAQAANPADKRAIFFTTRQTLDINSLVVFRDGYAVTKFKNVTSASTPTDLKPGSDPTGEFVDTDFPLFRLGDVYLMYAEAVLRGGGGSQVTALQYVNALRQRAYGNASGNITAATLAAPNFILEERGRELYWEGQRRTDLIRFGRYTGSAYLWPWKGNVKDGTSIDDFRTLYPLPVSDLTANPTLRQNTGY